MNEIGIQYCKTPIGELILGAYGEKLVLLDYRYRRMRKTVDARLCQGLGASFVEQSNDVLDATKEQLDEYLGGRRIELNLPVATVGSDFQKCVWDALVKVPFGTTSTYLDLATEIGNPKAVRAVAGANGANAISVVIPCHRIIGSNGKLVGYGGGLPAKKRLLKLERDTVSENVSSSRPAPPTQLSIPFVQEAP